MSSILGLARVGFREVLGPVILFWSLVMLYKEGPWFGYIKGDRPLGYVI